MKKRMVSILLAALMIVGLLPTMAFAEVTKPADAEWLVDAGDDHVWYKLTDGDTVFTIGGEGAMPDYSNGQERPWHGNAKSITSVVIEDGVTVIGKRAFLNFANVTKLTVPASVKKVSAYAFKNSGLTTITFAGKKAPAFTDYALDGTALTKISVPLIKLAAYQEAVGVDLAGIVSGYVNVTLNANGGTGDDQPVVVEGDSYTLPSNSFTAPDDKHFAGWARKAHGQVITDANITLTDDITLYAIWQNNTPLSDAASILNAAKDFEYDDGGQYNGVFTITGTTIVYSAPKNLPDPNKTDEVSNYKKLITNDFGAFFGTLYRFDNGASVKSITFDGDVYTWNTEGTLRGSNWQKGGDGDTLISRLGKEIQAETGSANITFKLNKDSVKLIARKDHTSALPVLQLIRAALAVKLTVSSMILGAVSLTKTLVRIAAVNNAMMGAMTRLTWWLWR